MPKWILDFEGYQIGSNYYPKGIALLNVSDTDKCFGWHIEYMEVFAQLDNNTTRCQFRKHGMSWRYGNIRLGKALEELRNVFTHDDQQHVIYIKGLEKTNWARRWFIENLKVEVKVICNTPNFSDLMRYYGNCAHADAWHLRCARSKTFMLLLYV